MCGINGLINFSQSKERIGLMNDTLHHRGPDAEGVWVDKNIALGHRRLAIIDLSESANQPFIKHGLVLVYNGEVYNFPQLREELLKKGVDFTTKSDTEVVLELFRAYGVDSINKMIGMFSFCIYDSNKKELFLVRDYFGIKPLYYTIIDNKKLAFSSELKALAKLPEIKKEINQNALVSCMNYLWIHGEESIFKNIQKLAPAHYLYVKTDGQRLEPKIKKYWQLDIKELNLGEDQLRGRLKEILEKSIKRHLISDVPVGAFLSGGLDSSLISVLGKRFNDNFSTYTISIGDKEKRIEKMPDDNFHAKKVASKFGINHTDIPITSDIIEDLHKLVYSLDEPIGDPAAINTYLICKLAKDNGIKVLLSGMGADEIFAGYRRQYATLLASRLSTMSPFLKHTAKGLLNALPVRIANHGLRRVRWAKRLFSFVDMPADYAYMRSYSYYSKDDLYKLFNYDLNGTIDKMYDEHREVFYKIDNLDYINRMCYTDINMFMVGLNLTYTDRASMAASVEARVPFIDKELIEFAMCLDGKYKLRKKVSKYLLKEVATDYLPPDIVYRPKASFGMPLRAWVSNDLSGLIDDVLSKENIKRRGFLDPSFVQKIIDDDRRGLEDNAYRIYQLLTLELWLRRYLDQ